METSRRTFLAAGLASAAGTYLPGRSCGQSRGAAGIATETAAPGEDGSKLWLRYMPTRLSYPQAIRQIKVLGNGSTINAIRKELTDALIAMLAQGPFDEKTGTLPWMYQRPQKYENSVIVQVATPRTLGGVGGTALMDNLKKAGPEGYVIRRLDLSSAPMIVIASETEVGALYGAFHFLRLLQTLQPIDKLDIVESPGMKIRMADHWDNPNGTIERGYAGRSFVFAADPANGTPEWNSPDWKPSPRCVPYARAAASIGMNGVCINNVNASATMLSGESIRKMAMLADVFRPFGIKVYLAANFSAPVTLGRMPTADPKDAGVQKWWQHKADEIYKAIPNFGGLLVKANSEGQPGPKDYKRTHAEGANCLAAALAPYGGVVIWRAFVYDDSVDPDRVKRAYKEFTALDGQFLPNVLIQIKNGPLDFQPREPFSPLFGGLNKTSFMAELQPSQEYLGQARHLVYLGTMWEEFLQSDTFAKGPGSTIARLLEGKVQPVAATGIAGVLNPGQDVNWTGHHFCQANWYALGRLAWNPELSAKAIAEEWTRMTFSNDPLVVRTIVDMMMGSRETFVNYSMPLGLHHMIGGDHYAPMPQNSRGRADWTATYYHKASADGIGYDRTRRGDDYVDQYHRPLSDTFDSLQTCPEEYLLWFHRLPWTYRMKSGKTLWEEIIAHYDRGVREARAMQRAWTGLKGKIDDRRHTEVADRLAVQVRDALAWRNQILRYFSGVNGLPVPDAPAP